MYYANIKAHDFMDNFSEADAADKIRRLKMYMEEQKAFLYVVQDGQKLVAFIWIHPYEYKNKNSFYIHAIAVSGPYRGRGLATRLYRRAFSQMERDSLVYTHVDGSNEASIRLHRGVGYQDESYQYMKKLH